MPAEAWQRAATQPLPTRAPHVGRRGWPRWRPSARSSPCTRSPRGGARRAAAATRRRSRPPRWRRTGRGCCASGASSRRSARPKTRAGPRRCTTSTASGCSSGGPGRTGRTAQRPPASSASGADVRVQMVPLGEAVRRGSRYARSSGWTFGACWGRAEGDGERWRDFPWPICSSVLKRRCQNKLSGVKPTEHINA